jgi:MFS family permease
VPLVNILVGAALLLFGRRLFWVFVAGVGFVVGAMLATEWFGERSDWVTLAAGLGVGIIGALFSIFLQRIAAGVAGFLAGGHILYTLAFELKYDSYAWIAFLVGGVLGALLVLSLFDWALVLLSALIGATVVAQNAPLNQSASTLLWIVLIVLGVAVQGKHLVRKTAKLREAKS